MKPMLSLEMMLGGGGGAGQTGPVPKASAIDDLEHRPLQIVWANGEGLDAVMPTRGTALLQHGFKEWAAALGVTPLAPGGAARRVEPAAVLQALLDADEQVQLPLVLCRDLDLPLRVLDLLVAREPCALFALGAPASLRLAPGRTDLARAQFPLPLPPGIDPGQCVWLGAPDALVARGFSATGGLRVGSRDLGPQAMVQHLHAAEVRVRLCGASGLWCVLFLDDVVLGDTPATAPEGVPPEALATTLRWLQRQVPSVSVFMVSHERVTPAQRDRMAGLARQLGGALHRHAGLRRERFAAAAGPAPDQKKR